MPILRSARNLLSTTMREIIPTRLSQRTSSNNNTRNNTNANAMDVEEAPLPTAPEIAMNYGIAYYISTNTGYRPVYAVDLNNGTSSFWLG